MSSRVALVRDRRYRIALESGQATVDGGRFEVDLSPGPIGGIRSLLVDGRSFVVLAEREGDAWSVTIDGRPFLVEVTTELRDRVARRVSTPGRRTGHEPVRAPMPGLVVAVDVEVGERIAAGQGVVTVEAMKMENRLQSPAAGIVQAIRALPGDAVTKGEVLVELGALP